MSFECSRIDQFLRGTYKWCLEFVEGLLDNRRSHKRRCANQRKKSIHDVERRTLESLTAMLFVYEVLEVVEATDTSGH